MVIYVITEEEKIADRWIEYVESLYKDNEPELLIQIQQNGDPQGN
jgi:hypothetical protein